MKKRETWKKENLTNEGEPLWVFYFLEEVVHSKAAFVCCWESCKIYFITRNSLWLDREYI